MQSLREDFNSDLNRVERRWIRLPATIFLTPLAIIIGIVVGAIIGAFTAWDDFTADCWRGPEI